MAMGRVRRSVRWRSTGVALAFVLAVVAGVAGNQLTGHLSAAWVVFVVFLTAGAAVSFLLERAAGSRVPDQDQGTEASGSGGTFDLRGAQGVQVGDSNRQANYFGAGSEADRRE